MRDKILKAIQAAATKIIYSDSRLISAFKERGIKVVSKVNIREISLECPENENFGDYSTNFSMTEYRKLAERTKSHVPGGDKPGIIWAEIASNPIELAKKIVSELEKNPELLEIIKKIEVAGKGFINFYLSEKALLAELDNINRQGNEYGTSSLGKGKTVIVDYSSPNIAKRFGIGHLRSTVIGQSLYNLYKTLGYKVIGDNHLGDWGTQFGTLLYQIDSKGLKTSELTIDELEKLYVEFNAEAKSNEKLWDMARAWFKKLEEKDPKAREIWQKVVDISLKEFERIYDILGVNIDYAYGESSYLDKMNGVIEEIRESGLLTKSQGAEIIEFKDLPPAIVVKSDGATTYLARDLAAIRFRIGEWKPDIFIYEVGSDQTLYFRQLFETVRLLGWKGNSEFVHVAHGLIRFEHGKMSTRKGETVSLEEVLSGAVSKAKAIIDRSETGRGLDSHEKEKVAKAVGIGAVKYFDLMHQPGTDIIFDWEKVFVLEGNSAPYLQYTVARANSVLEKGSKSLPQGKIALNPEEQAVLRGLTRFSEIIAIAAKSYSPNLLANYLFDLAQKYNNFYAHHRILGSERTKNGILSDNQHRLALTAGVAQVLKNGLGILGIDTPQRM